MAYHRSTEPQRFSVSLVTQGRHRFYTLTLPSDVLANTCFVTSRDEDPKAGFQRVLDKKRAQQIADYVDTGLGTIPTIRNRINYDQSWATWFPYWNRQGYYDDLIRHLDDWRRDPLEINLGSHQDRDLPQISSNLQRDYGVE